MQMFSRLTLKAHPSLKSSFDQRIRFNLILAHVKKNYGKIVLDVGCGPGILGKMIEREGRKVIYLSPNVSDFEYIKVGVFVAGDGTQLPFKDKAFDFVLSSDVLEHVPKYKRAAFINEMMRTAKKKAIFTFSQVHPKNPLKSGIRIFEHFLKMFKIPYPSWYKEHGKEAMPRLEDVKMYLLKWKDKFHLYHYQGVLALFFLGSIHALTSFLLNKARNKSLSYIIRLISKLLDYFSYLTLRIVDIPPYYSFKVVITLSD